MTRKERVAAAKELLKFARWLASDERAARLADDDNELWNDGFMCGMRFAKLECRRRANRLRAKGRK